MAKIGLSLVDSSWSGIRDTHIYSAILDEFGVGLVARFENAYSIERQEIFRIIYIQTAIIIGELDE